MGVIDIKDARLSQQLNLLAELAGKPQPAEKMKQYYGSRLKHCTDAELERAFAVFGDRGIWPTVEQVLNECGHRPIATRQEQQESLVRDQSLPRQDEPTELPAWETAHGERCFRAVGSAAIRNMEAQLSEHGWTIIERRPDRIGIETKVGRVIRIDQQEVLQILAVRWKEPPTTKELPPYLRGKTAMQIVEKLKERCKPK